MHLIHHHHAQTRQVWTLHIDHVAQHLGGHHHQVGRAVQRIVPGEQTHSRRTPAGGEVTKLLVGERFDRSGVERPAALGEGPFDPMFGHEGLARTRGRRDQHRLPVVDRLDRPDLKLIGGDRPLQPAHEDRSAFSRRLTISFPTRIDTS